MTQEEKQLLLKDICARLPYGIWLSIKDTFKYSVLPYSNSWIEPCTFQNLYDGLKESVKDKTLQKIIRERPEYLEIKPYLRPMYSMTDDEVKEYLDMLDEIEKSGLMHHKIITKVVDWLDKKMIDYRGLIPMNLALEALDGMYKIDQV